MDEATNDDFRLKGKLTLVWQLRWQRQKHNDSLIEGYHKGHSFA